MKISDAIQSYLKTSFDRDESVGSKKFYLSDMGKCPRTRWLKRKGVTTEFEPHVYWILQLGNLIHDYGYKALESQGLLLQAEDYVETDHFIGRFDGLVKNGNKKSVFDFKSTGSYKMSKVMGGEDDEENISQLLSYVLLLQQTKPDISETAYAVYLNKEPSNKVPINFIEKEYHLTSWRAKQLQEEMDQLVEFWVKDKIPPCKCPGWMKPYNAFQPLCSASEADIKKYLKHLDKGKKLVSTNHSLCLVEEDKRTELLKI